jgi:hypothetical protein
MNLKRTAIARLVRHCGGVVNVAERLELRHYQQVQTWLDRGWCSPMYLFDLERMLPPGMTVRDLHNDRTKAKRGRA